MTPFFRVRDSGGVSPPGVTYLASVTQRKTGMLPRRSRSVRSLMPALVLRKRVQGKTDGQWSMVEASRA